MYDDALSLCISAAFGRMEATLSQAAPWLTCEVRQWVEGLSAPVGSAENYFKHPNAFPMLLLPWWVEKSVSPSVDLAFQNDLIYSTITGYYHVRMVDNLMDQHTKGELAILPALAFFCSQFQSVYQRYFSYQHPFWEIFNRFLIESCAVTIQDAKMQEIGPDQFIQIAARKTCGAKIPLAAVCFKYDRMDLFNIWEPLVDRLGCWHQMQNDLYDWPRDLQRQTPTYFLSEVHRQKLADESAAEWILRTGLEWGSQTLQGWMNEMKCMAASLASPDLTAYLNQREMLLLQQKEEVARGFKEMQKLFSVLS